MRKSEWFLVVMAVVFFATGAWFYPQLPAQIATHWNAAGQVNGMMSRTSGIFAIPIIFVILAAVFFAIPRIDPRRDNIAKFRGYYDAFVAILAIFLYYIYVLTLVWNLEGASGDVQFRLSSAIIPAIAALIYIGGMLLPQTKPNWFIGVRTPWTISSETVWKKANKLGGILFRVSGAIMLFGIFFPLPAALWFIITPIIASAIWLIVYSYVEWAKERK
jgi:uncharacterized membrane protein